MSIATNNGLALIDELKRSIAATVDDSSLSRPLKNSDDRPRFSS